MVRELTDLLEEAWHTLVEPDWPRLRALLDADVAFHSRRLAEVGLGGLLPEIDRRFGWRSHTLTVEVKGRHERHLAGQGLVLIPSVFSWPDVISDFEPPWQATLVYPARGIGGLWAEPTDRTPDSLVRLLGRGRSAVLTALDEPAGTTALAVRLRLAPSSVSAHLAALRDAGLLVSRRYGHQVLYERTPLGIALASGGD
jgi:DNA-binding transcriptional ArsR family regulator